MISASLAALFLAAVGGQMPPSAPSPALHNRTVSAGAMPLASVRAKSLRSVLGHHPQGPGWTHAQVQRMAAKRRNQARHRATCRRRRH
jgi:hypothetical protein